MTDHLNPADRTSPRSPMSADEFAARRLDFPEGGRWFELHEGQPVLLQSPDDIHGNIVLNLSRELAKWFQARPPGTCAYAAYDLGLHVRENPDTVYFPAISCFREGRMFSQNDLLIAEQTPHLVVDIASSNDRRQEMRMRSTAFMDHGVEMIWIPDPFKKEIQVLQRNRSTLALGDWQTLDGGDALPGFSMPVKQVFAQPAWWTDSRRPPS